LQSPGSDEATRIRLVEPFAIRRLSRDGVSETAYPAVAQPEGSIR
jgi:hypothetical protein